MDVTKYKPGRRLDAMVAMALGWKWVRHQGAKPRKYEIRGKQQEFNAGRWLAREVHKGSVLASKATPLLINGRGKDHWVGNELQILAFSTNDGAAFEAALEAGVLDNFAITTGQGLIHQEGFGVLFDGVNHDDIEAPTHAHVLCLGILAIQPEETLAEYESWLEGVE